MKPKSVMKHESVHHLLLFPKSSLMLTDMDNMTILINHNVTIVTILDSQQVRND